MTNITNNFIIGNIRVGSVEGASCINLGNNTPNHFESHKKHNQGFGTVGGDNNKFEGTRSMLHDPDTLDSPNLAGAIPEWVENLVNKQRSGLS
ncbi:hypothetical protein MK805_06615 [Shimazuella sp. AN120528]|uniref:hypothetical protein n=1 Tax=Shimazuella soli TaxID=1892854 RepID=UPI001F0F3992|nr:hypothetical protein [Shimazuella soli]MCH5584641.1 hypothetical protein [Shimazuella soli]